MPDDNIVFPTLVFEDETPQISPSSLPDEDVIEQSIATIRSKHERIANILQSIWGYQECADYLQKLVFNGSDPSDLKRLGFTPDVASALMELSRIHKVTRS